MRKKAAVTAALTLFFLFWIYIAAQVPYTHDDWDWGCPIGLEQWLTGSVNSRLVGNFFVVVMTRSPLLKTIVMGCGMFLIPLLLSLLAGKGSPFLSRFFAANLCALSLPITIWRQTYGWVSGFANYGISTVMLLGWILLADHFLFQPRKRPLLGLFLFPYTLIASLILENIGALLLVLCLFLTVWSLFRHNGRPAAFSALFGAALGCFLLFYNPLYQELGATGAAVGGVRKLAFPAGSSLWEIICTIAERYFTILLPEAFRLSVALCLMIGFLPLVCLWRGGHKRMLPMALLPLACALLFRQTGQLPVWFPWVGTCICWLFALLAALLSGTDWFRRLAPLLIGLGSLVPIAAIVEKGERLFLLPFLLVGLSLLDAAAPLLKHKLPLLLCLLGLCTQMVWYVHVYQEVAYSSALRSELTTAAVEAGETKVILPTERYPVWWGRNPQIDWRAEYYRQFYGLPSDLTLIFLPAGSLDNWPEISEHDWKWRFEYGPYA